MLARIFKSTVVLSVVAFLAVAKGVPTSSSNSECDGGQLQCCQQMSNSSDYSNEGGLLGILGNLGLGNIGLNCVPINVLGIGNGAGCTAQTVCCTDVSQSGLINVGCSPINLGL